MAVKYVDPILGSDTTGDGSAATPWQTQSHAMAAMAASDTLQIVGPGRLEDMLHRVMDYSNNRLHTDAQLVAEDVEIGAVEIKNATDDTRATVGANGLHVDVQAAGTPITDQALEAGGAGVLGWLASIRKMVEALKTTIVLAAGSAIIGKVGIDQTTDGTTNAVNVKTTSGAGATIGATDGAAVITDANGTLQQYLRGLVKLIVSIISVKIDQTTPGTTNGVVVNAGGAVASLKKYRRLAEARPSPHRERACRWLLRRLQPKNSTSARKPRILGMFTWAIPVWTYPPRSRLFSRH